MLHIITPLYRFDLIERVYGSIFRNDDITWHISYSIKRELPDLPFLKNNNQIKIYPVDCEDSDTTSKRNTILSKIKDGYFCFLDDDTIFHENMYMKYLECTEHNFISHHKCLEQCVWPKTNIKGVNQKDFLFWDSVYNYYNKKCAIWNQTISIYNKLN